MTPDFLAFEIVADQPEGPEVTHDMPVIRCGSRSRRAALAIVEEFEPIRLDAAGPKQMAVLPGIAASLELSISEGGQKYFVSENARRRRRPGHFRAPQHAVSGTDFDRRLCPWSNTRTVWAAK